MAPVYLESDLAYKTIKEKVISLKLKPGSIFTESQISSKFKLGKSPTREALKRLEQDGLVTAIPYKGYKVKEITVDYVNDLMELRKILEGQVSKILAEKVKLGDANVLASISRMIEKHEKCIQDGQVKKRKGRLMHINFHVKLNETYSNQIYKAIIWRLFDQIIRVQNLGAQLPDRINRSFDEHLRLLVAIAEGKPRDAERLAVDHVESVKKDLEQMLGTYEEVDEGRRL